MSKFKKALAIKASNIQNLLGMQELPAIPCLQALTLPNQMHSPGPHVSRGG